MPALGTSRSCIPEDDLLAFAGGQVAPSARREIVEHLRSCAECRAVVAELVRDGGSEGSTRDALVVPSDRPSKRAESRSFEEGQLVQERYEVIRFVARGGMGEVYEVFDRSLCEHSALKTLRGDYCDDAEAVERLKREVRLMRKVSHPSICRIGDFGIHRGDDGDIPFYTMEYVDGETLSERIKSRGPMTVDECLQLCSTVAAAIDVIHAAGIIHRDIKAGNVMLEKSGRVILTDFGLATVNLSEMTLTGAGFLGSPLYVAPEQARGTKTTAATDVYAFGVLVYYMLSGTFPFVADTPLATVTMRLTEPPRPLSDALPEAPAALWSVLRKCLDYQPSQRFVSCGDAVRALERAAVGSEPNGDPLSADHAIEGSGELGDPPPGIEEAGAVDGATTARISPRDEALATRGASRLGPWRRKALASVALVVVIVGIAVLANVALEKRDAAASVAATPAGRAFISFRTHAGSDPVAAAATYDALYHLEYARMTATIEGYAPTRPLSAVEWADLAVAWMSVGEDRKAAAASMQAVDRNPPPGDVREYVAAVFDDVRGRRLAAKDRYAKLWEKFPGDTYFGFLEARAELRGDAKDDAEGTLLELTRRGGAGTLAAEIEGFLVSTRSDPARVERTATRLIEVSKANGSPRLEARARRILGTLAETRGDAVLAMKLYREAESLYLERGEPVSASDVTDDIAQLHRTQGRAAEAVPLHESVLAIKSAAGQARGMTSALINLGAAYYFLGRFDKAEQVWSEGLAVAERHGYLGTQAPLLSNLAATKLLVEDLRAASSLYRRAIDKASAASDHQGEVYALEGKFEVALVQGRIDEAQEHLTRAASLVEAFRIASREDSIDQRQAVLAYGRGDRAKVEAFCATTLPRARPTHDQDRLAQALPLCAMVAAIGGNLADGLRLVDEARANVASLEPSNPRREAISRADAFVAYLVGDVSRCLRSARDGAVGTESLGMNGPSAELRALAALARDSMGELAAAREELEAAKVSAARSVDPRSMFRVRAVAAMLSGDATRLEEDLRRTSKAGFVGVADELRALARARASRRRKP